MTGLTTWERWKAGLPARDKDDRDRYREYDAARTGVTEIDPALSRKDGPLQVLHSPNPAERAA
jgi:hypothetical protein